jgi:outer membrane lipoprotein-sorting protein
MITLIGITALTLIQIKPHATPKPLSADAVLKQMYRQYDTAASYDGTVTTTIRAPNGQSTTVIHAQAQGDRRGLVARSRIEILTAAGKGVTQSVRIDDGRDLWTVQPSSNSYRRDIRKADRLSNLFRPFFSAVEGFAPKLQVRRSRIRGVRVLVLAGRGVKGGFVRITLDGSTNALIGAGAVLASGENMSLSVSGENWNNPLPRSIFEFHIPPGAHMLPAPRPGGVFGIPNFGNRTL